MDEMTEWEIELCIKNMHYAAKNEWEQARLCAWSSLAPYFKKGQSKQPNELFPLATDNDETEKHTDITKEEIERLQEYAKGVEAFFASQQKQQNDIDGITS